MLRHDSVSCLMFQTSLAVLLCAILGGASMQVKYFTLYGDFFFSIVQYFQTKFFVQKTRIKKTQEFSISSPLLPSVTDY